MENTEVILSICEVNLSFYREFWRFRNHEGVYNIHMDSSPSHSSIFTFSK